VSTVPADDRATVSGPFPESGVADAAAVGNRFSTRSTVTDAVAVAPSSSVTVSVAMNVPAEV
jgi:hypothetical protein